MHQSEVNEVHRRHASSRVQRQVLGTIVSILINFQYECCLRSAGQNSIMSFNGCFASVMDSVFRMGLFKGEFVFQQASKQALPTHVLLVHFHELVYAKADFCHTDFASDLIVEAETDVNLSITQV
jgi:hypothetical protein